MKVAVDLSGRRILITGGGTGIGAATATVCARLGAEVLLIDIVSSQRVVEMIRSDGGRATSFVADAASQSDMERLSAEIGAADGLVLNAAICPWDEDWLAAEWDASFNRVMAVNVLGPIYALRAFLPAMLDRRRGHIVFVGSLAGRSGGLIAGPHYVASKGAVHALVKWLARQVAPQNVIVNGVAPASIETPMMRGRPVDLDRIPLGRLGKAEEIGWPIAFLCSDAASYICGAVIDVNGGVYMA
jgi:NAD(P)-dependent dehydrogenase (short-subunit alcohol dehydrogenase family)